MLPHFATQRAKGGALPGAEHGGACQRADVQGWLWRNRDSELRSLLGRGGSLGYVVLRWRGPSPAVSGGTGPVGSACRDFARVETGPSGIHWTGTAKRMLKRHLAELGESSSYPRWWEATA